MIICGLDECGRGPLAGPIVAAGVILHKRIPGLNDSKRLSAQKRQLLFTKIIKSATVAIESISVRQINSRGIGWANKEVFKRLIKTIDAQKYIVDGNLKISVLRKTKLIKSVVKADAKYPEVMAASIVAKVTRDAIMRELHHQHPEYGWQSNMGYGTIFHINALLSSGITKHHRKLFVTTAMNNKSEEVSSNSR